MKARHFAQGWDGYSKAFQEYWSSLSRKQKTSYINSNIEKVGKTYENFIMHTFTWMEKAKREKAREQEMASEGCIQEVAETRLGGRSQLEKAINRGDKGKNTQKHGKQKTEGLLYQETHTTHTYKRNLQPIN